MRRRTVSFVSLLFLISGFALGQALSDEDKQMLSAAGVTLLPVISEPTDIAPLQAPDFDLRVQGVSVSEKNLQLSMVLGRYFTRGVKVYSEPSHTLLLTGMTQEMLATPEGLALAKKAPTFTSEDFPGASPSIEVASRPATDWAVLVYAIRANGDYLVAGAKVGTRRDFGFKSRLRNTTHCCDAGTACETCITCSNSFFTCCGIPGDCSCHTIYCGWIECEVCV